MSFPTILDIKLGKDGRDTMKEIQRFRSSGSMLKNILGFSSPLLILTSGNPVDMLFTVLSTDWEMLGKATSSVDRIVRNRVETVIQLHLLSGKMKRKERLFWKTLLKAY